MSRGITIPESAMPERRRTKLNSQRTEWGDLLVEEWYHAHREGLPKIWHARVGPRHPVTPGSNVPEPTRARMYTIYNRRCDLLIFHPDALEIVEADVLAPGELVMKLMDLSEAVDQTPELEEYLTKRRILSLVYVVAGPTLLRRAQEHGVALYRLIPDWIDEWAPKKGLRFARDIGLVIPER